MKKIVTGIRQSPFQNEVKVEIDTETRSIFMNESGMIWVDLSPLAEFRKLKRFHSKIEENRSSDWFIKYVHGYNENK